VPVDTTTTLQLDERSEGDLVSYKPEQAPPRPCTPSHTIPSNTPVSSYAPTDSASHVIGLSTADNRANVFAAGPSLSLGAIWEDPTPAEIDHVKMEVEEYIAHGDFPAEDDSRWGVESIKLGR
jgi:hypothetical protein